MSRLSDLYKAMEEWKEQPRLDKHAGTGQAQDKYRTSTEQAL